MNVINMELVKNGIGIIIAFMLGLPKICIFCNV